MAFKILDILPMLFLNSPKLFYNFLSSCRFFLTRIIKYNKFFRKALGQRTIHALYQKNFNLPSLHTSSSAAVYLYKHILNLSHLVALNNAFTPNIYHLLSGHHVVRLFFPVNSWLV